MCHGQLLSQALVQARKNHQCDACGKHVEAGRKYVRTVAVVDGDFQSSKLCPRCQAMLEVYSKASDTYDVCFSLSDMRILVKDSLRGTGAWAKFKAAIRAALACGPQGAWHT